MSTQKLSFENPAGQRLAARLDMPVDGQAVAFALFAHCFTCSKDLKAVRNVGRAMAAEGIAVLSFDFTGLGGSEGEFSETGFMSNVDDLVAAADYMERTLSAPAILVGHSLGGAAVLRAAERIPSASAVATIGAPSSPGHLLRHLAPKLDEIEREGAAEVELAGRSIRVGRKLIDDLTDTSMSSSIAKLGRALLVFHSPVDEVVGIENATEIFVTARHPKSFVSLDTADHLLSERRDSSYVGSVIANWARKYIGLPQEERKLPAPGDNLVVARTAAAGYRTELLANGHPLVSDEPLAVGGTNTGPTPYELLAAALGACTTMTLRMYADRKHWPLEAAEARVRHAKVHCEDCADAGGRSRRIDRFTRELLVEGPLDDEQRKRLLEIADRCPVHRTLHSEVEISTKLIG
jgi:putative redox protein